MDFSGLFFTFNYIEQNNNKKSCKIKLKIVWLPSTNQSTSDVLMRAKKNIKCLNEVDMLFVFNPECPKIFLYFLQTYSHRD